ncbi:MAG: SulP family inorganic anion transporter [Pseudomonadota bacterium]|nr:SulP family inorganic anion transporter [Pseudomonadota bacterium]
MKLHLDRKDIEGGIIATLFALPVELIYGRLAVAPLGPLHFSSGIQAALWTCVMTGFLAAIFRGTPGIINGSSAKLALILAALTAVLVKNQEIMASPDATSLIFALLFLCTVLAGVAQCAFALLRISRSLKFIPYPVIAGTMVGSAIAMSKTALVTMFGVGGQHATLASAWHPLSLVVAAATVALCARPPAWLHRIPFMLTALVGGTCLHYVLSLLFGSEHLGSTWSTIDSLLPPFSLWNFVGAGGMPTLFHWAPMVFPYALAIAAIASMESMLCLPTIEAATARKPDSERELWAQGLGNMVAGFMGGFPSEAVGMRSRANVTAGARTRISGLAYSIALALLVLFGSRWIGKVPEAVTAGLILYLAYTLIDDGTRRLIAQLLEKQGPLPRSHYKMLYANAAVLAIVALVVVFGGMLQGTFVGMVAAMILFILTSMKPVIRSIVSAQARHSLKIRTPEAAALLQREGKQIQIIELEGVLFFGTAERLAQEIGKLPDQTSVVILDFCKVREIDATAARTLFQLARRLHGHDQVLLVCGTSPGVEADLAMAGMPELLPPHRWYHDTDHALEAAENHLLAALGFAGADVTLTLGETTLASDLTPAETGVLESYLAQREVAAGTALFVQGDVGDSLFVCASGVIDICLPLRNGKKKRVASFAPGMIVGEMAFIDNVPRSAEGHVGAPTMMWELTRRKFDEMASAYPFIAHKIMLNLSRGLSGRLRTTTQSLRAASANGDFSAGAGALLPGQVERRKYPR